MPSRPCDETSSTRGSPADSTTDSMIGRPESLTMAPSARIDSTSSETDPPTSGSSMIRSSMIMASGAASPASDRTAGMAAESIPSAACSPCGHTLPQAVMVARTISRYFRRVVTVGLSRWRFDRMRNNHHDRQVHRPRHDRFHSKFPQGRSLLASFTRDPALSLPNRPRAAGPPTGTSHSTASQQAAVIGGGGSIR